MLQHLKEREKPSASLDVHRTAQSVHVQWPSVWDFGKLTGLPLSPKSQTWGQTLLLPPRQNSWAEKEIFGASQMC